MRHFVGILLLVSTLSGVTSRPAAEAPSPTRDREPVVGAPCEGCEAVFEGLPDILESDSWIGGRDEPGQPLRIVGSVLDPAGEPAAGVIVYAYQTNSQGIYPPDDRFRGLAARRHGRLRGWAISDAAGNYSFMTIRPAGYPESDLPAHVHMHVIERGRCTYYIDDILFDDDPRLTKRKRAELIRDRGGSGLVFPRPDSTGTWVVRRDIHLGRNIPGYP